MRKLLQPCPGPALLSRPRNYAYVNIQGRRFGRLLALELVPGVSNRGSKIWRCQCDCGNVVELSYNVLVYAGQRSCGCKKREHNQVLGSLQARVDGTSLDLVKSKKVPSNNTTGVKGVYFIRGKFVAKLVFQKKAYYLGTYETLEAAAAARRRAEENIVPPALAFHEAYQARAAQDPQWARENPMHIQVQRVGQELAVTFSPQL